MAITFHCEHCGKKIEAVDSAGGKWSKCPSCHNKLYVPDLNSSEEIKLAPLDKNDEEKQKKLMAETYKLTQDILLEREELDKSSGSVTSDSQINDKELQKNIITYLRQIANGDLDEAQQTANLITTHNQRAVKILDRIALSEIPEPELADIPQQVLSGLIRTLRSQIS